MILEPTVRELRNWILDVIQHSSAVEYYCHNLGINPEDDERPHDIGGKNGKLSYAVAAGLALGWRTRNDQIQEAIRKSIDLHREQRHHQMWNGKINEASDAYMQFNATDAVCSQTEDRPYNGGIHTLDQIITSNQGDPSDPRKIFIIWVAKEIKRIPTPQLHLITSIHSFNNIGIPPVMYEQMRHHVAEAITAFRELGYRL